MRFGLALGALAILATGCRAPSHSAEGKTGSANGKPSHPSEVNRDPFTAESIDPNNPTPAYVADGDIGVRLGPDGSGYGVDDKPLPAYSRYSYDDSSEEKIKAIPNPFVVRFTIDGKPAKPGDDYRQVFDFRTNSLATRWNQGGTLVESVTRPEAGRLAQEWKFSGSFKAVTANIGLRTPQTKNGPGPATWTISSAAPAISHSVAQAPGAHGGMIVSTADARPEPRSEILIEGPVEDQRAVSSFASYLRESLNLTRAGKSGFQQISPMGLSSDHYNGHVFWDADIWIMPALAFIEPSVLESQAAYRQARIQPVPGAPFVWESSLTGKETAPSSSRKEIHISGSVLWGLQLARALGAHVAPLASKRVEEFYRSRITKRADSQYDLNDVMSPDENHIGNNDLYTNLLVQWVLNGETWKAKPGVPQLHLPKDEASFLTYDADPVKSYKQAAAILAIYPLQYPPAEAQAMTLLDRFKDKVIPNGPAMSASIDALIEARFGSTEVAYKDWEKSWQDFTDNPFLLFSEKRNRDITYFQTGAAGCLQTVIYGFLGIRIDEKPSPHAQWSKKVDNGMWLSIEPHLPQAWRSVTFKNFHLLGKSYTLTFQHAGRTDTVHVTQGD